MYFGNIDSCINPTTTPPPTTQPLPTEPPSTEPPPTDPDFPPTALTMQPGTDAGQTDRIAAGVGTDAINHSTDMTPPPATVSARDNSVTIGVVAGLVALMPVLITGSCVTVTIIATLRKHSNKKSLTLQMGVVSGFNPAVKGCEVERQTQDTDLEIVYSEPTTSDQRTNVSLPISWK